MRTIDKYPEQSTSYPHLFYRACRLTLTEEAKTTLEKYFGLSRFLSNHLLNLTQDHSDADARRREIKYEECEAEILKKMNASDDSIFKDGLITPELMKGLVVSWVSEWNDFRHERVHRPTFKRYSDVQKFYILDMDAVAYTKNNFKVLHTPELSIDLTPPKHYLPERATAHLLKKEADGSYWLYSLHEAVKPFPATELDEELTNWGKKMIQIERELKNARRRYLNTSGTRRGNMPQQEHFLMTLRKISLDRLLRQRESKILMFRERKVA